MGDYYKITGPHFNLSVTGEGTKVEDVTDEVAALRAEVERAQQEAYDACREEATLRAERDEAWGMASVYLAEVERMRPVVEAALDVSDHDYRDPAFHAVINAYREVTR